MNILLAAAEINPFAKGGGMADVTSYLCIEWAEMGHDVVAVLPSYKAIDKSAYGLVETEISFDVSMGFSKEKAVVYRGTFPNSSAKIYLIGHEEFFDEEYVYGDRNEDEDDDRRFIFFNKAIPELCKAINFKPDILNCHDYHTSFVMPILKTQYQSEPLFERTGTIFTIHNLSYQGIYDKYRVMDFTEMKHKEFEVGSWFEHEGKVNFMKTGIMYADRIITVSPTYAEEIKEPYYSEGMQDAINSRLRDITGVLNGVNYRIWDPKIDIFLSKNYNSESLEIKEQLKLEYLEESKIPSKKHHLPLISFVNRLTEQKGLDIIENKINKLLSTNKFILAVLGEGQEKYEDLIIEAKNQFPNNVILHLKYDEGEAHRLIAASDFLLMPSKFEPCGLTQMYALKYGTIPIVRSTGGLADTITNYISEKGIGNGISFPHYNRDEFEAAIRKAVDLYKSKEHIEIIRRNGMEENHSSKRCAKKYIEIFKEVLDNKD
ncbi:MAG: glycogen/starch synthase [Candidatus Kapaibacterium sp.]|nr:glycogen synthase [Ignavibacteriota bacterium]MCB9221646.1 glycogen synthase [Ignavibacteria bacterium]